MSEPDFITAAQLIGEAQAKLDLAINALGPHPKAADLVVSIEFQQMRLATLQSITADAVE